jgi:hypothetical protein
MAVPSRLLIHQVVVVRPSGSSDAYGTVFDYGGSATRSTISGWLDDLGGGGLSSGESFTDGRDILDQRWTLITNHTGIDGNDRIEWGGHPAGGTMIFTVDGPPEPKYTPRGAHHLEARLRRVEG